FPSHLPFERVKNLGAINFDEGPAPAALGIFSLGQIPGVGLTVSPDGQHLAYITGDEARKRIFGIATLNVDGGSDYTPNVELKELGEQKASFLPGGSMKSSVSCLAFSSDGKYLFVCGVMEIKEKGPRPAIYK